MESIDRIVRLSNEYKSEREKKLLDTIITSLSVSAFTMDSVNYSKITPQMEKAFELAYPNLDISNLDSYSGEQIQGIINGWKGKLFEVKVQDQLNAGEWVGDIHLEPGQSAVLAETANQPGWDLQILNIDGTVDKALQLKATNSIGYIYDAIEKYPDINVLGTEEIADKIPAIFNSGMSEDELNEIITEPIADLVDSPGVDFLESILPGLPFVIITTTEGFSYFAGKKSFNKALLSFAERSSKSAFMMGVGGIVVALDGGLISIPASFISGIGFDYFIKMNKAKNNFPKYIENMKLLRN